MKISETINSAAGNMARPTKFSARIFPPMGLVDGFESKAFDVMCKTIGVPETIMEPIDLIFKGHTLKVPGRVNQSQEITVTFYLDEYHKLRRLFYDWINSIDDRGYGSKSIRSKNLYDSADIFGSILLKTRDFTESLNSPMDYEFENVYPTNIGGVEFNTAGTNEVMEFTVTFAYTRFRHISTLIDDIDDADNILDSFGSKGK